MRRIPRAWSARAAPSVKKIIVKSNFSTASRSLATPYGLFLGGEQPQTAPRNEHAGFRSI
jgi:hypothetical protein